MLRNLKFFLKNSNFKIYLCAVFPIFIWSFCHPCNFNVSIWAFECLPSVFMKSTPGVFPLRQGLRHKIHFSRNCLGISGFLHRRFSWTIIVTAFLCNSFSRNSRHYIFCPTVVCPTVGSLFTASPTYIETCTFPDQFKEMGVIPTYSYPDHRMSQDLNMGKA